MIDLAFPVANDRNYSACASLGWLFGHALLMVAEEDDELCHSGTDDEVTEMIDNATA